MSLSRLRALCIALFACGIAGMIVSSVNGNNNGWVITCGFVTAIPAISLLVSTMVLNAEKGTVIDESLAERVEQRVAELHAAGADEESLRDLVRDAVRLGRRA